MWLSDDDIKKLAAMLAHLIRRHLAENGGQPKGPPVRLLTVEEAAAYIGRTKSALEHMICRGEMDGCLIRRDRRVHIDRVALDKWCETHRI